MWKPKIARSLAGPDIDSLHLMGSRCGTCGKKYFPARKNCPHCMTEDTIMDVALSDAGKLHSFVVCGIAPPGYEVPHVQGYIDLDDGGPRIFSLLTDYNDEKNLKVGCAMKLTVIRKESGTAGVETVEYRFAPVESKKETA
ncbi:MAG: hypothetical protein HKM93_17610 [Desulfobacteraceae bacterium]|nr:hypothetical protein [Desulfobacteraceae bacterium]